MGKLVYIFPGQGSQSVGMGRDLAQASGAAAKIYERAVELLGWDLANLSFEGPEADLAQTSKAQAALYVNSMAVKAALDERGAQADIVSGHSLGEYSALAAAGAFDFETGLRLVAKRGEAMSTAAGRHPGAMAAILGLEDARVEKICAAAGEVWPVNYNCPGQLVISGETGSVERAMTAAEEAGAKKAVRLAVSGSFHSPLMKEAADVMKAELESVPFYEPAPPFLSSISCEYESAAGLPALLMRQIVSPVRWRQAVERLIAEGADRFLEVGNGKVLSGLVRRINRDVATASASDPGSLQKALVKLNAG